MRAREIRGHDKWGSGEYKSPRGGRIHMGVDLISEPGEPVSAMLGGKVTKIGYPYPASDSKKGHLRYVEVCTESGLKCRYFYLDPFVCFGKKIEPGETIGFNQVLTTIYPGVTQHFHLEFKKGKGFVNPMNVLKDYNDEYIF